MKKNDLKISWKNEEERVFIGWDFTCLNDRIIEEELPWDYRTIVQNHLKPEDVLPYEDESMDIIINRHESYDIYEVYRVLKKGGIFITQQVGGEIIL